ncbi:MAG: sensor histidine kinase [Proteobacteria bacterium]|nr:sensor histidine kinase [Pseudomonadota bacterium]
MLKKILLMTGKVNSIDFRFKLNYGICFNMSGFKGKTGSGDHSNKQIVRLDKKGKAPASSQMVVLRREVAQLKVSERKNKRIKEMLQKKTHALGERVKELNCLYTISNLVEKYPISLDRILRGIVDIIPPAWQYPDITCARINIGQQIYVTSNFTETPWRQSSNILIHRVKEGSLDVYYLEERPKCGEGPFLKEERSLINAIAKRIGDIIERKRLEKQVLEISEREQQRIGQDLHDSLCQQLTGIAFLGKVLQKKMKRKSFEEARNAGEMVSLIDEAITQTKGIAQGLYPVRLEVNGLMAALSELSRNMEKMFGITCIFEYDKPVLFYDNMVAIHIYRIIQEAVNNAIKHGKATKIVIKFSDDNGVSVLTIKNNGRSAHNIVKENMGMGISIMKHRANMIGAYLDIKNFLKGGTIVTCLFENKQGEGGAGKYEQKAE